MRRRRRVQRLAQATHTLYRLVQRDQHVVYRVGGLRKIHTQKLEPESRGGKQRTGLVMQDARRVTKLAPRLEELVRQAIGFVLGGHS
jgi:hypothetical protein